MRFCSMVRSASWLARNIERMRVVESSVGKETWLLKFHFQHGMALI